MQAAAFVKRTKPALTIIVGLTSLCARILTTMKPDTAWVWELTNAEKHNKFVDPLAVQRLGRTRGILSPAGVIDSAIRKNYAYKGRIERLQFWIEQGPESYLPSPESFSCDFLFLSRREDDKGLADLIRATAITAVSTRNFRILVAGSGNAERYIRLTEDLKVDDIVRFVTLDSRSDVISVLSRARYVVLPSHHEGFPISILEGTQYSIPFITTPVGAIPEMLGESQACRLNPPGDVNALAESMKISLSESAQLYEYRRKAAFEKHSQMLTRKTAAEKLLALSRNA
jgi:glycosyltransferase involved in cell wall biosynthesis